MNKRHQLELPSKGDTLIITNNRSNIDNYKKKEDKKDQKITR